MTGSPGEGMARLDLARESMDIAIDDCAEGVQAGSERGEEAEDGGEEGETDSEDDESDSEGDTESRPPSSKPCTHYKADSTRPSVDRLSLSGQFVLEAHYENGRRYANADYLFPNDDIEETRLTITHQGYLLLLMGELTVSRISPNVKRILDVGGGPGDWAIAMAEKYPGAEVTAVDITNYRIQNTPPNLTFQIDDASHEWTYDKPFDVIHMRDMHGAFRDWSKVFAEARKHLKPDGKLEVTMAESFELGKNAEGSYSTLFWELFRTGMTKSGFQWWTPDIRNREIEKAGLKVLKKVSMDIPLGLRSEDPKKSSLGKMCLVGALESVEACSLRLFTQTLGWSAEQVKDLCEKVKRELMNLDNEPYLAVEFIVAIRLPGFD